MVIIDHGDGIDTFINGAGDDDGEKDKNDLGLGRNIWRICLRYLS